MIVGRHTPRSERKRVSTTLTHAWFEPLRGSDPQLWRCGIGINAEKRDRMGSLPDRDAAILAALGQLARARDLEGFDPEAKVYLVDLGPRIPDVTETTLAAHPGWYHYAQPQDEFELVPVVYTVRCADVSDVLCIKFVRHYEHAIKRRRHQAHRNEPTLLSAAQRESHRDGLRVAPLERVHIDIPHDPRGPDPSDVVAFAGYLVGRPARPEVEREILQRIEAADVVTIRPIFDAVGLVNTRPDHVRKAREFLWKAFSDTPPKSRFGFP